jgi:hypothetical protein
MSPRRLFSAFLSLALAASLSGCGLFGPKITREMRRSPDYRAGYQDGCSSAPGPDANQRNGFDQVKDQQQFDANKNYRAGWNAGYTACRTSTPQSAPRPYSGPIRDQNPGNGGIPRY